MTKSIATLLAAASLGIMSLGVAACDDGDGKAAGPAGAPSSAGGGPATATSAPSAPGAPAPVPSRPGTPSASRPVVRGSQVIMIDPEGKKYTRREMVQLAAGLAATTGKKGLPPDFCDKSYKAGVNGGGKFPAGREAFMEACREGVRLAG